MKLHLPCGLRKALLACLAALAAHCRVPRTVSTGTALLGVFTMLWGAASHAATQQDQDSPLSEDEEVLLLDEPDELTFDAPNLLSEDDEYGLQRFLAANNEENVMTISQDDSGIMVIDATDTAQKTQDVSDRSGIGVNDPITYSGWIFSMNVGEATPEGSQSQPFYGGNNGEVHVKYYHWVPNGGSTGMEYSTSADGTVESWNGRQGPTSGPDGKNSKAMWTFFDSDTSGSASIYHTLRLEGGDSSTTYSITSDFHSNEYSLCFGGLIVEAGQGGFTVGGTARTEKVVLRTGTAVGVNFEALILSNFAFTTRNRADNLAVSVESNANFRVGKGITMDFGRWVKVAGNMSLNLSSVGSTEGSANVTMGRGLDLGDQASLVVGEGVTLTVGDILTGTTNASLVLETGSNVTLNGSQSSVYRLQLEAGSNLTSNNPLTINTSTPSTSNGSMLTVNGGVLNVTGKLGIIDSTAEAVLTVDNGGSVTVGSLGGTGAGHAGRLKVGGVSTFGTLTVGTQAESYSGDAFKAKSLYVQNSADDEGEGSVVTIYGNVNFYNFVSGQDDYAMIIAGKSAVTIDGTLHGNNASTVLRSVKLDNGGNLRVKGAVTFGNNYGLEVLTNGVAVLEGGLTASSVTVEQGSLTAGGATVTGAFTMQGSVRAEATTGGLSADFLDFANENGSLTVGSGGTTVRGSGAGVISNVKVRETGSLEGELVTLENGKSLTLERGELTITDAVNMSGGELRLSGGAVSVANGIDASGGTLVLDSVRVAEDLKITLRDSAVLEVADGAEPGIDGISRITLGIEVADDASSGGKLKLTKAAMDTLLKWKGQINFSITGAPIGAIWDYKLFDDTTGWSSADTEAAESFLKEFLGKDILEGRGGITVDSSGNVHYALAGDLTWTGQDGETGSVWDETAKNWEKEGKEAQVFEDKDSVTFGTAGSGHSDIIVSGELTAGDIRVEGESIYSFTGEEGDDSINAVGNLYVRDGSSATFSNLKSFSVAGGTLQGTLRLENTRTENSLGSMIVKSGGGITIVGETARTTLTSLDIEGGSLTSFGAGQDGSKSVGGAITVNGAMTVSNVDGSGGQVDVTGDLSASSLVVSGTGVSVIVSGTMGVGNSDTNDPLLRIDQGGSVTAGSLKGFGGNGYAGRILVGGNGIGTLTVGSEGKKGVLVLEARGLSVQGGNSSVTVHGDASLYGSYDNDHALLVTGATVDIRGTLRAPNSADDPSSAVRVEIGGNLSIGKGAWVQGSLEVLSNSNVKVDQRLSLEDSNDPVLIVTGGSSVTAGSIWGWTDTGVAGRLTVGDAASAGTLTVGVEGYSVEEEVLKAKSLYVQHANSNVTINGDVKLTGTTEDNNNALKLEGSSSMTVHGGVHGAGGDPMSGGVSLNNGSHLTVDGDVASGGNVSLGGKSSSSLTVDGSVKSDALQITNGTATLKGGLTANSVSLSNGSLQLGGEVNVSGAFTVSDGTLTLGVGTGAEHPLTSLTAGERISLVGGTLDLSVASVEELGVIDFGWFNHVDVGQHYNNQNTRPLLKVDTDNLWKLAHLKSNTVLDLEGWNGSTGLHLVDRDDVSKLKNGDSLNSYFDAFLHEHLRSRGRDQRYSLDTDGMLTIVGEVTELTWDGSAGDAWRAQTEDSSDNMWNMGGESGLTDTYFRNGEKVIFTTEGKEYEDVSTTVAIDGIVRPDSLQFVSGTWTITKAQAEEGEEEKTAVVVSYGQLKLKQGTDVTFKDVDSLTVLGATIEGHLTLDFEGTRRVDTVNVSALGRLTIKTGDVSVWEGSTVIHGSGAVILDAADQVVTVNGDNNLFAVLLAGGDATVQRDRTHEGIGSFVVASGTTLQLAANAATIGKGLSLARQLVVQGGASIQVDASVFDYGSSPSVMHYNERGTLVLAGDGIEGEEATGALKVTAEEYIKWAVELADDASIYLNGVTLHFGGAGAYAGAFHGNGKRLTVKGGSSSVLQIGENFRMVNEVDEHGGGTIEMTAGTRLQLAEDTLDMSAYAIVLNGGSLDVQRTAQIKSLSGNGGVSYANTNQVLEIVGWAEEAYTGSLAPGGLATVKIAGGARFLLGDGAAVGNKVEVYGTLSTDDAAEATESGEPASLAASVSNLNIAAGSAVGLGKNSTLTVSSNLAGLGGGFGSIEGKEGSMLVLRQGGTGGTFGGWVSSSFTYAGGGSIR